MIWSLIILCGAITFLIRFIPLSGIISSDLPLSVKHSFKYIPLAVLTPIIVNDLSIIENKNLCIPHKHMHQRNFVLIPMSEIAADIVHPKYNKTVAELLIESQDIEKVSEYEI